MADMTLCNNSNCPRREECYRAQCTPSCDYQSYSVFVFDLETGRCGDFIKYW